ncbi:MAG TPA: hypothetical protein VHD85_14215 [Terracidiphilus sp.]|nr:hypothetical protein [Terracidiphilus sp.]
MGTLLQPWFLVLFGVTGFFVFLTLGANEDRNNKVPMRSLERWMIIGICVVIVTLGIFKIQQDRKWNPFHSVTKVVPVTVR